MVEPIEKIKAMEKAPQRAVLAPRCGMYRDVWGAITMNMTIVKEIIPAIMIWNVLRNQIPVK
jgi:hypothetical protein